MNFNILKMECELIKHFWKYQNSKYWYHHLSIINLNSSNELSSTPNRIRQTKRSSQVLKGFDWNFITWKQVRLCGENNNSGLFWNWEWRRIILLKTFSCLWIFLLIHFTWSLASAQLKLFCVNAIFIFSKKLSALIIIFYFIERKVFDYHLQIKRQKFRKWSNLHSVLCRLFQRSIQI
jgi:hypothetical protein